MKEVKVLLTPSSSGMAISAIKALRQDKNMKIISTDIDELAPGLYLSDKGYLVPPFKDESFYLTLKKIVKKEKIDVIIPCLDTILLDFSKRKKEFENVGAKVLISNQKTIEITRDKWKTYNKLKGIIPLPKSFIKKEDIDINYPLVMKPRCGSGSKNVYKINSKEELDFFYKRIEKPIIQEYLEGKEYTVDCLADMNGKLIISIPRERIETRGGISVKGKIVENKKLNEMAERISGKLSFRGPFFFQAREDVNRIPKMTEINARIAGGMCLSSFGGLNIHILAVRLCMGEKIEIPRIRTDLYLSRYWEEIYLTKHNMKRKVFEA
ncbi:MAG: ATP-grasp domain-containing protein [Candidatus Aminicenantaceae bacterium]